MRLAELPATENYSFALRPHKSVAVRGGPALIHPPQPEASAAREENPKAAARPLTGLLHVSNPHRDATSPFGARDRKSVV